MQCSIIVKDTVSFKAIHTEIDTMGRYIILICKVNNVVYTVVNVYLPNVKQLTCLKNIWKLVQKVQQGHTILCSDLNAIPNKQLDVSDTSHNRQGRAALSHSVS